MFNSLRASIKSSASIGLLGFSCSSGTPPAAPTNDVSVVRSGDTTVVTVEDHSTEPENPTCKAYCERLSACWYAVPNADPMLARKDVLAHCRAEQHQCKAANSDLYCCAALSACGDFVKCQSTSHNDVVADCEHRAPTASP